MRNHRAVAVIGGVALALVGLAVAAGFRVGACVDGAESGSCTFGPDVGALAIGAVLVLVGAIVAARAGRPRR